MTDDTTSEPSVDDQSPDEREGPHGPESAWPRADGSGPDGWTIKATEEAMVFHTTDSPDWRTAQADVWFADVDAARAAGFEHWDPYERTDLDPSGATTITGTASGDPEAETPHRSGLASTSTPRGSTGSSATHVNPGDHQVEDLAETSIAADHVGPYGPGSAQPMVGGSGPDGWPVKATGTGTVYHTPDSPSFDDVSAIAWFVDESTARAAGFVHWDPEAREGLTLERVGEGPHGAVPALDGAVEDLDDDDGDGDGPDPVGGTLERDGGPADPGRTGKQPRGFGALDTHDREPIADLPEPEAQDGDEPEDESGDAVGETSDPEPEAQDGDEPGDLDADEPEDESTEGERS